MLSLDTNILIAYLSGEEAVVNQLLKWRREERHFFISVINEVEVLSFSELSSEEIDKIEGFLREFTVIPLDSQLGKMSAGLRRKYGFSLGDSVVIATASITNSKLITRDQELIKKLKNSNLISVETIE